MQKNEVKGFGNKPPYRTSNAGKCCLCGAHIPDMRHSHNPAPVEAKNKNIPYRCCTECNFNAVLPARMCHIFGVN